MAESFPALPSLFKTVISWKTTLAARARWSLSLHVSHTIPFFDTANSRQPTPPPQESLPLQLPERSSLLLEMVLSRLSRLLSQEPPPPSSLLSQPPRLQLQVRLLRPLLPESSPQSRPRSLEHQPRSFPRFHLSLSLRSAPLPARKLP